MECDLGFGELLQLRNGKKGELGELSLV
jgi:hypothetical protein